MKRYFVLKFLKQNWMLSYKNRVEIEVFFCKDLWPNALSVWYNGVFFFYLWFDFSIEQ